MTVFHLSKRIAAPLILMALLQFTTNASAGAASLCDPTLTPVQNEKIKYMKRGDRCEGFYRAQLPAGGMDVVGLVQGSFRFSLDFDERVTITSPLVADRAVHLRAQGIPLKTYYRLDALIAPQGKFTWPIGEVVLLANLRYQNIGIYGWVGSENERLYIPVRTVAAKMKPASDDRQITLYLRSSVNVRKVQWRSALVSAGQCGVYDGWNILKRGKYRTAQPIRIVLPSFRERERCIETAAREQNSARWVKCVVRVRTN